ncbi:MAG: hypothetical protein DRJ65_22170 [Acidobacteria bacterium]|nr:MAG: hypothetical protein DRJ65_22170 [Acidobacteriota bacterium]
MIELEAVSDSSKEVTVRGFTLLECVIAIALIGSALIISTGMLNTLIAAADRVEAHTEMLRELEAAVEMMRSGFLPLESGILTSSETLGRFSDLRITVVVEKQQAPGLYLVIVRAECRIRQATVSRTITTQIWRE